MLEHPRPNLCHQCRIQAIFDLGQRLDRQLRVQIPSHRDIAGRLFQVLADPMDRLPFHRRAQHDPHKSAPVQAYLPASSGSCSFNRSHAVSITCMSVNSVVSDWANPHLFVILPTLRLKLTDSTTFVRGNSAKITINTGNTTDIPLRWLAFHWQKAPFLHLRWIFRPFVFYT